MSDRTLKALIVEDEPHALQLTMRALAKHGFECAGASNGAEARARLATCAYDAVVTDLRMPKEHGYGLTLQMLELPDRPVIVVMTGVTAPQLATDLLRRGVDDLQYKPVNYDLLAQKLRVLVETRREWPRQEAITSTLADEEVDALTERGGAGRRAAADAGRDAPAPSTAADGVCVLEPPLIEARLNPTGLGIQPVDAIAGRDIPGYTDREPTDRSAADAEPSYAHAAVEAADFTTLVAGPESARLEMQRDGRQTTLQLAPDAELSEARPARSVVRLPASPDRPYPASPGVGDMRRAAGHAASSGHWMWGAIVTLAIVSVWLWIQLQILKQGNQVISALERVGARIERRGRDEVIVKLQAGEPPQGLEQLVDVPNLDSLVLAETLAGDEDLKLLQDLKTLRMLDLAGTKVSDRGLKYLTPLANLQDLSLEDTQITDEGLKYLLKLKMLQRLSLRGTQVTGAGVTKLQNSRPHLEIDHRVQPLMDAQQ
ncbi:MAG TPA: response regulator [Pirellulales bacterium]|nr:response regulator [Pirellulales bacterium]